MRLIPGEIRAVADHLTDTVKSGVAGAVDEVTALLELVGRATKLLDDAEQLASAAAATLASAQEQLAQTQVLLERTNTLVEQTQALAAPLIPLAEQTLPALERAAPMLTHLIENTDPAELDALVRTINHLPALVDTFEEHVLPNLSKIDQVGPDVHEILTNVNDLTDALLGMPGMTWAQRRGVRKNTESSTGSSVEDS